MSEYSKWNKYVIGKTNFIKTTKDHPHRKIFTDFVIEHCGSVVEVGPGEMLEYQVIRSAKQVDYTIVDVSDVFIGNCKEQYPDVKTVQCPMEEITPDKIGERKDIIYGASVIEHSKNPEKAISSMFSVAAKFHIVLFKWQYKGDLRAQFHPEKGYWSTCFNIQSLLDVIAKYGEIEYADLVTKAKGRRIPFGEYRPKKKVLHRTGDYLVVHGRCK